MSVNHSSSGKNCFRWLVVLAMACAAILILLNLKWVARTSYYLAPLLGASLVIVLIIIPTMRRMCRLFGDRGDSGYYRAANLFVFVTIIIFANANLSQYIEAGLWNNVIFVSLLCLLLVAVMALLMGCISSISLMSYLIPLLSFLALTVSNIYLGGKPYYFGACVCLTGIGAIYCRYRPLLFLIVTEAVIILALLLARVPLLGEGVSLDQGSIQWEFGILAVVMYLMLVRFASNRNLHSIRAERTFSSLMATTPNIVAMVDRMNCVTYLSEPMAKLAHVENAELAVGRPLVDLFHRMNMKLMISDVFECSGYYENTMEVEENGESWHYRIMSDLLGAEDGGRFIDISEVTPMVEARLEAERASRSKSAFLAKMSHEIRTPMNAVIGMSELILREDTSHTVSSYAADIKQAGTNLLALIDDILDFSKIESGKLEIMNVEYDLGSLLNDVITIIKIRLMEKPVRFSVHVDSHLPGMLIGDETRVRQILLNLLSNAVKYTRKGHIFLDISGKEVGTEGLNICCEVRDTGIGIMETDLDKLFGDFAQVDSVRNKGIEGTGLGLAITRSLSRMMGGDIVVESAYGEGSVFTVTFLQGVCEYRRFAEVKEPEKKDVLIYEPHRRYVECIVSAVRNLGVFCKRVTTHEDLVAELSARDYAFIFAPSYLLEDVLAETARLSPGIAPVLFDAEPGEHMPANVRALIMPTYAPAVANILNGLPDAKHYVRSTENGARFILPDARVLVVDDLATNLRVAQGLMAIYEMRIDCASSGHEAIELVSRQNYDVIFMDHMMPGMDGVEAAQAIRGMEGEYFRKVPIIALTANAISGMREMFLDNGFNDFLSKPIEITKLDIILNKWISKEKRRAAPPQAKKKAEAGSIARLLKIEGVDISIGLSHVGGSEERYQSLLDVFRQDAAQRLIWLEESLSGDMKAVTTHVHALKSALANIGANTLSKSAALLEAAGHRGDDSFIRQHLDQFRTDLSELAMRLDKVLAEVHARAAENGENSGADEAEREQQVLAQLRTALKGGDLDSMDTALSALQALPLPGKRRKEVSKLAGLVLISEFEEALRVLDAM
ncbi:MAG: response regulator [Azoarcus sp.]|jgi:signal transduction histidine kinase/CheY-like chemotaxis protein|nr:response regulator [Azoarcus sp.]